MDEEKSKSGILTHKKRRNGCSFFFCGLLSAVLSEKNKNHIKPREKPGENQHKTTIKMLVFVDLKGEKEYNKKNNIWKYQGNPTLYTEVAVKGVL